RVPKVELAARQDRYAQRLEGGGTGHRHHVVLAGAARRRGRGQVTGPAASADGRGFDAWQLTDAGQRPVEGRLRLPLLSAGHLQVDDGDLLERIAHVRGR